MRQVVLKMHVSVDGYINAGPGDTMDWVFGTYDDQLKAWEVATLWEAGLHIMGRNLYHDMANYWPTSTEEFAPPMNTIPKVVFSKTLTQSNWQGCRVIGGDLAEEMALLKAGSGKLILAHGGGAFTQSLTRLGLIDEYRLVVHPVALGGGIPLFAERLNLRLLSSTPYACGAVVQIYGRA